MTSFLTPHLPPILGQMTVSYPRRQQLRRLTAAAHAPRERRSPSAAVSPSRAREMELGCSRCCPGSWRWRAVARCVWPRAAAWAPSLRQRSGDARAAGVRGLAPPACGGLAGPRGSRSRPALPVRDGFVIETKTLRTRGPPCAHGRLGALARAPALALSRRGASGHLRHTRPTGRANRGRGARRIARPPDARACAGHAPSAGDHGRCDDRTSTRRLTSAQCRVDDRIEESTSTGLAPPPSRMRAALSDDAGACLSSAASTSPASV